MTAAAIAERCLICDGHGTYRGEPCQCSARPFGAAAASDPPACRNTRDDCEPRPVGQVLGEVHLQLVIDRALTWSSAAVGAVIRLAEWQRFLDGGGDQTIVLGRIESAAEALASSASQLDDIVADLRSACQRAGGASQ